MCTVQIHTRTSEEAYAIYASDMEQKEEEKEEEKEEKEEKDTRKLLPRRVSEKARRKMIAAVAARVLHMARCN